VRCKSESWPPRFSHASLPAYLCGAAVSKSHREACNVCTRVWMPLTTPAAACISAGIAGRSAHARTASTRPRTVPRIRACSTRAARALRRAGAAQGVGSAEDIDKGMVLGTAHKMGPLHLADFIGAPPRVPAPHPLRVLPETYPYPIPSTPSCSARGASADSPRSPAGCATRAAESGRVLCVRAAAGPACGSQPRGQVRGQSGAGLQRRLTAAAGRPQAWTRACPSCACCRCRPGTPSTGPARCWCAPAVRPLRTALVKAPRSAVSQA